FRAIVVADVVDGLLAGMARDDELTLSLLRFRGDALAAQGKFRAAREILAAAYAASTALSGAHVAATLEIGARLADVTDEDGNGAEGRRLGEEILAERIGLF